MNLARCSQIQNDKAPIEVNRAYSQEGMSKALYPGQAILRNL
jgi:hypothetical protein